MTGTVPDLVRSAIARTKLPRAFVEQRARALQGVGLMGRAVGAARPAASPRDLANLLISLGCDRVRAVPAMTNGYADLARLGECDHAIRTVRNALEKYIGTIWATGKWPGSVTVVKTEPLVIVDGAYFYPDGTFMERRYVDDVRAQIEFPGVVIAQIGADVGFSRCRSAV